MMHFEELVCKLSVSVMILQHCNKEMLHTHDYIYLTVHFLSYFCSCSVKVIDYII